MRNAGNLLCGNHERIGHIEDPDVYGGNSITMNFRYTKCENGDWIDMNEVTVQGQIFVNRIMNLWDPQKSANFLTCWSNTNFWGTNTQLFEAVLVSLCPCCCWYVVNRRTHDYPGKRILFLCWIKHHAIKALNKRDFPASDAGSSAPQLTAYSTHCIGH